MIVIGSANMDIVIRAAVAPEAGETVLGLDYALYPGGKGANQAVAARRAGAAVSFVGCLGCDDHGDRLAAGLAAEGIRLEALRRVPEPTGTAFITVERSGENRIIVVPGANHALTPALLPQPDHGALALLQLEIPLETAFAAASLVRSAGGTLILNASPAVDLAADFLAMVDILLVNQAEAGRLLGMDATAADAARRLAEGRRAAVVTLGGQGASWLDGTVARHVPGHEVRVVDTTGCGDAFAGAFAAAFEAGESLHEAVRWGNAAGALAAMSSGAQPSLPARTAIKTLLGESG